MSPFEIGKVAVLAVVLLTGAAPAQTDRAEPAGQPTTVLAHAFKGHELYSWRAADGQWRYTLTFGTNRRKLRSEVEHGSLPLRKLERELAELPSGEHVSWSNEVADDGTGETKVLAFPPEETLARLRTLATSRGLDLWIPGPDGR
jgi:hypothetical protein